MNKIDLDIVKNLVTTKYFGIGVSELTPCRLSLYYSRCLSYKNSLSELQSETVMISDQDYDYVFDFLVELNTQIPIHVFFTNTELGDSFETHYAYLRSLLEEYDITYGIAPVYGVKYEKLPVIIDIVSSEQIQERHVNNFGDIGEYLYFAFVLEEKDSSQNDLSVLSERCIQSFIHKTKDWIMLSDVLPFKHLYSYVPISQLPPRDSSRQIEGQRRLLYAFKDGKLDWTDNSVLNVIATEIEELLFNAFESNNLPFITWFCIPPMVVSRSPYLDPKESDQKELQLRYTKRFGRLSDRICSKLGMRNGMELVDFDENGDCVLKAEHLKGATMILFDDIVTRGTTALKMKEMLEDAGAKVLCFISIAKTVHPSHSERQ